MLTALWMLLVLFALGHLIYSSVPPTEIALRVLGTTMMATPFILMLGAIADEVEKIKKLLAGEDEKIKKPQARQKKE